MAGERLPPVSRGAAGRPEAEGRSPVADMRQVIFRVPFPGVEDGIPIYGFGLMLFVAFVACTWLAGRRAQKVGIDKDRIQDLAIWLFIGGLAGSRAVFLLLEAK